MTAMESMPDSGVEIKNAVVAPWVAPCLRSDTAAGSTPQLQSGTGTPIRAALNTDEKRPLPRWRAMEFGLRNTLKSPLTTSPNRMYTAASNSRCRYSPSTLSINSMN